MWLLKNPQNIPPMHVTAVSNVNKNENSNNEIEKSLPIPIMITAKVRWQPMKQRINKQTIGTADANKVATFLAVVVLIFYRF